VLGGVYCKRQSLVYYQSFCWHRKLTPIEDFPKYEQVATGFTRVASVSGASIGAADGLTVSLPGGFLITGLYAGNIDFAVSTPIVRHFDTEMPMR
jgi:hypothetical protein